MLQVYEEQQYNQMDLTWLALIIPVCYYSISLFFLCFPGIIHRQMRYKYVPFNDLLDSNLIFCIGHRGGSWQGPQNTLELFQQNHDLQHMFELDVCLTKDGVLVVHHDSHLLRTCGIDTQISQLCYSELPRMKEYITPMGGEQMKTQRNKLPLLEELFERFPTKPMNIDLKTPSVPAIKEFNRLICHFERENMTIWGCMGGANQEIRKANPQVINFYSIGQVACIFLLFLLGLLPFVCLRHGVLDIQMYNSRIHHLVMGLMDTNFRKCLAWMALGVLRLFTLASRLFIPHLRKRGILTFLFILNDQQDYETAVNIGCSGIMTDKTRELKRYLQLRRLLYDEETYMSKHRQM